MTVEKLKQEVDRCISTCDGYIQQNDNEFDRGSRVAFRVVKQWLEELVAVSGVI